MPTRAAAKREAAFLLESLTSTSSSLASHAVPLEQEAHIKTIGNETRRKRGGSHSFTNGGAGGVYPPDMKLSMATPSVIGKRKRTPPKTRKILEPIAGGFDILPHGLGKQRDLASNELLDQRINAEMQAPPLTNGVDRGIAIEGTNVDAVIGAETMKNNCNNGSASGDILRAGGSEIKTEDIKVGEALTSRSRRGRARRNNMLVTDSFEVSREVNHVPTGSHEDILAETYEKAAKSVKHEGHHDRNFDKIETKDVSEIVQKDEEEEKKEKKKKKASKYGLTPGYSPFPDFVMPTPDACEEVNRLLSELHGEIKPPEVIPPPSMEVTGCGEVPDLLDAILRTLLSASTSANNSNLALAGLKNKFGLRTSGVGEGSINWEAVHKADLQTVIKSIKKGGLAKVKGTNIKKILDMVHEQNCIRRDNLLREKKLCERAKIHGEEQGTPKQKLAEIFEPAKSMLSMDHIFEMTTDEAMEELTKLPGIGVKTTSCVILFCMKRPSFAVDTHVWRLCKWLGWVPEKATRDQTFSHCEVRVPDHLKYPLHQLFLRHGKTCGRCKANRSGGTQEWKNTVCPIDHLVARKEKKKMTGVVLAANKNIAAAGGKKRKKARQSKNDEPEESDFEFDEGFSEPDEDNEN